MRKAASNNCSLNAHGGVCNHRQRERLLTALQEVGSLGLTTIQIREQHDIMMPAARVHELRWDYGYNIQTISTSDENAQGNIHLCTRYVLLPGEWRKVEDAITLEALDEPG